MPEHDEGMQLEVQDVIDSLQQQLNQKTMELATAHAMLKKYERSMAELQKQVDEISAHLTEKEKAVA